MGNDNKINLLVNIVRLYYEHNYSQKMIAEKFDISRPYVSKLINEAREMGIVEIKINDPFKSETQIEMELRERFRLLKVIAIPSHDEKDRLDRLGKAAARYLNTIVKSNDIIGVAWGLTLYTFSQNVIKRSDLENITVVQLCGGISNIERNIFAAEIPKNIADAYMGTPYILPIPAVMDNIRTKEVMLKDKSIYNILDLTRAANIAIFTMGPFGYDGALSRAGYINREEVDKLLKKGAVGDICTRFIDSYGHICDENLNDRTMAIDLFELKKKEYRIGIAMGENRIKCILGSLKGGYVNVLVTDEDTAIGLMKLP